MFHAVRTSTASIWAVAKIFVPPFDDSVTLVFERGERKERKGKRGKKLRV